MLKSIVLTLFSTFLLCELSAQNTLLIRAQVLDSISNDPLLYASVVSEKTNEGTSTNEQGIFEFKTKVLNEKDSLLISFIGYNSKRVRIQDLKKQNYKIYLSETTEFLTELTLEPKKAVWYLQQAFENYDNNLDSNSYRFESYFKQKAQENKRTLFHEEAYLENYFKNKKDTSKDAQQASLVLFWEEKDVHDLKFMEKQRKKYAEKRKDKKDSTTIDVGFMDAKSFMMDYYSIANMMDPKNSNYLKMIDDMDEDKVYFSEKKYLYQDSSEYVSVEYYDKKERARITCLINTKTFALKRISGNVDVKIPILLRPVLLVMGVRVKDIIVDFQVDYQEIKEKMYPKMAKIDLKLDLVNFRMFRKNIPAIINSQQLCVITKLKKNQQNPIPKNQRIKSELNESEAFNPAGIQWDDISVVK
ncbi:MAG: carboxypeptidase-like regulatory domain-containing protein [Flavobacteriales bacterium]|jgi:hypothetical protein|nr:carboxypeptidase-like regulatory domain-containing protein [Flavobacteriales bacterium]